MKSNSYQKDEPLLEQAGEAFGYLRAYAEIQIETLKLDVAERLSNIASGIAGALVIGSIVMMVVSLLSIALAIWMGDLLGGNGWGFLAVAGIYLLLIILLHVFRKSLIVGPVTGIMLSMFFNKEKEKEDSASSDLIQV